MDSGEEKRATYLFIYSRINTQDKFAHDRLMLRQEAWSGSRYSHAYLLDEQDDVLVY